MIDEYLYEIKLEAEQAETERRAEEERQHEMEI